MMRKFVATYFAFTKKERTGVITLSVLILLASVLPIFYTFFSKEEITDSRQFEKEIAALQFQQQDSSSNFEKTVFEKNKYYSSFNYYKNDPSSTFTGQLFPFDPNTISAEEWKKLGVKEKTIQTIQNYLSKGGHFYKPEDIAKIWGLRPDEVERLKPFIEIQPKENIAPHYPGKSFEKTNYTNSTIDINHADTTAFISLPGIGSKLAQRIVTFREKMGGFYKLEQVAETFGLPDSTYQKIKLRLVLNNPTVKKININSANIDELKNHPYIRYNIGNAIIQYRNQHGNFNNVEDIKKVMMISEEIYLKIKPYLTINEK